MNYKLNRFGNVNLKDIIGKLKKDDMDSLSLIQYSNKQLQLMWKLEEINSLKEEIEILNKECKNIYKEMEEIHNQNPHLSEDYVMTFNISKQNKKLANNSIGVFWIINLKYRGTNKSIYLGSDKKVREIVSTQLNTKRKLSEERLKSEIYDMCYDKLWEFVIENKQNLFDIKIKFEDLI
ncbi:MAG: hypothetical protein HWE24_20645 [Oceanospirillaceae bacterium]|nr:hypothetical protein [Oceanospirillaceae bacterium]